ncbi:hypothetical protein POM88_037389 [Heracleum sosnowskyi]|uniref:RRM domain-containing protein n=1 Tax=Heracleum sosnowskyi TaxID=360622 RepID=A0AAD8MFT2_9APIA|nr:hypothetical protein POM88_037389 [Heracleum sosnowskyi]
MHQNGSTVNHIMSLSFILAESDPAHQKVFVHGLGWDATSDQVFSTFSQFGEIEDCKDLSGRKIFVANVGVHVSLDALKAFFGKFGELEEGPLGLDMITGKFKGFSIFVYKNADGCKKALEEPVKGDINSTMNYNVGVNPGFYANPLIGQSPGFGLANSMMALNQSGMASSLGVNLQTIRFSGNYGINSVSPSVIASYDAQNSLQGLGAYQSQLGQSSAGSTKAVAARPQSAGFGSTGQAFH